MTDRNTTSPSSSAVVARLDRSTKVRLLSGAGLWQTESVDDPRIPSLTLSDGPHGLRIQDESAGDLLPGKSLPATCFPTAVTLASTWNRELATEVGAALGAEAVASGVDVVLGPGLNLKRHPAGGRNFEYFSEDPLLSGTLAAAMVRGIQAQGVAACPKHFAVNSQESNRMRIDAVVDQRTLRELYLRAFEIVVREAQPWTIMSAYNRINGTHAGASRWLLTDVLRSEWGFDGLVVSDWYATHDRPAALRAGLDLEMPGTNGMWDPAVEKALDDGTLAVEHVDQACRRLVELTRRVSRNRGDTTTASLHELHHELARRVAAAGTVLLTNDGILPLSDDQTVGVIGTFAVRPRYQGGGSSRVNPTRVDALLSSLSEQLGPRSVSYAAGYDPATGTSTAEQIAEAVDVATRADVALVVVGLPTSIESEGWDRDDLALPTGMNELVEAVVEAQPRTVVVLQNGAPVTMRWAKRPAALMEAWLGGQAGGAALADVLTGAVEPSGRLPESFPVERAELAADADFGHNPTRVVHREGLHVGYRFYDTCVVEPAFPFGHGLGYTTWDWGGVSVSGSGFDRKVTVRLTNTGDRRGSQVVQLYVHACASAVHRPEQELAAFTTIMLDGGESMNLELSVDRRTFAIWDVAASAWLVEPGAYELRVGASSRDIRARIRIDIDSDDDVSACPAPSGPVMTDDELEVILGHPVPRPTPLLPFHRDTLVGDLRETLAGRATRMVLGFAQRHQLPEPPDEETRLLVDAALREAPLRTLAAAVGGRRALRTVDAAIRMLNLLKRPR